MSQVRHSKRHSNPPFSGTKKESSNGPPLLCFTPTNNYAAWRRSYLIRAKTEFGIVGDALAAKSMPDFEALLIELTSTGSYTSKQPNPEARRSSIYGFALKRDSSVPFTQAAAVSEEYAEFPDEEPFAELNPLATPTRTPSRSAESAHLEKMLKEAEANRSSKTAPVLSKAEEIVLAGKIKRIQDSETLFQNILPKLCGDIMTYTSDSAGTRIRNHKHYERAWMSNNAVELMQIIEDCSVVAPHDLERRIKTLTTNRDAFYQYSRTLESYTEEFDDFERQLVMLGRPTLESQLVLNYLDHLHPSYANTITLLRTADKLPHDYEGVKQTIKSHESNARAQASSMKGKDGAQMEKQDTAMAATSGNQPKGQGKRKGKQSSPKPVTAAAATEPAKSQPKSTPKADNSDLIECAFCKKWGRHTAQECNQLKAFRDKNPARTVSAVVVNSPTNHSGDDIVLASVAALSGEPMYDSDEFPDLLSDSDDSSDDDEPVRRHSLTYPAQPGLSDSDSVPGLISESDDSSDDELRARPSHCPAPAAPAPRRPTPPTTSPRAFVVDSDDEDSFFPSVPRSVHAQSFPQSVTGSPEPTVTASVTALAAHKPRKRTSHPDILCLDNACTTNIVRDRRLLRNIRTIPARTLQGLGVSSTTIAGDLPHFGFALFVPSCPFNLVSFTQAREIFNIDYDQDMDVFRLTDHSSGREFDFAMNADGLYSHTVNANGETALLSTDLEVNGKVYTSQQVQRARAARALHQRLGHPSDTHLIHGLDHGAYLECTTTSNDVRLAHSILGKCPGCAIGKATEDPSPPSTSERAAEPGTKLHMDIAFVNGRPYLVTVDDHSGCISLNRMNNKSRQSIELAISKIIAKYNSFGHKVRTILCDREIVFTAAEMYANSQGVQLLRSGPGRHAKRAERAIRTLKEKFRSVLYSLPYRLPSVLYAPLLEDIAQDCNLVPTTASGARTPREVVTGVKFNVRTHLRAAFGDIVIDKTPNQSSASAITARAETGIVVGRDLSSKGDVKIYILQSGETVIRHSFEHTALTEQIRATIDAVSSDTTTLPAESKLLIPQLEEDDIVQPDIIEALESTLQPNSDVTVTTSSVETPPTDPHRGDITQSSTEQQVQAQDEFVVVPESAPYSLRPRTKTWREYGLHITIKAALSQYPEAADPSMREELTQLLTQGVWKLIHKSSLSPAEIRKIIPSSMFLKAKHKPDGAFDKLKSRLVAGGHRQDTSMYDDVSSPCVNLTSVFTMLSIAAFEHRSIVAVDIKGAYLNAHLSTVTVHMRIQPQLATILKDLYLQLFNEDISDFFCSDGTLIVHVLKALYGLVESALLWYKHLAATLNSAGYSTSKNDRGVFFNTISATEQCSIAIHVDDLLVTSTHRKHIDALLKALTDIYKDINVQDSADQVFYLGMQLDLHYAESTITVSQPGFIKEILAAHPVSRSSAYPATEDLFKCSDNGTPVDITAYASRLMKLNYLAKRSRPDISLAVSYLATRMKSPDQYDDAKLTRVYEYLSGTQDIGVKLRPDKLTIHAWIDASYSVHCDYKSHTAIIVCIGETSGPVYTKSSKQKLMTDSSTFAELVALHDGVHVVQSTLYLMQELGYHDHPAVVHQDNMSTMFLASRGPGIVSKSRHIPVRYYYVHDCIERKELTVVHCASTDMRVDYITKPKTGKVFRHLRDLSMGNKTA